MKKVESFQRRAAEEEEEERGEKRDHPAKLVTVGIQQEAQASV